MKRRSFLLTALLACGLVRGEPLHGPVRRSSLSSGMQPGRIVAYASTLIRMNRNTTTGAMMLSYGEAHHAWVPVSALPHSRGFRQTIEWRSHGHAGHYFDIRRDGKAPARLGADHR